MARANKKGDSEEEERISPELAKQYRTRISVAKQGQEAFSSGNYTDAIRFYNQYLKIISQIKKTDPYNLSPTHFNPDEELSEMFLISQVYWALSQIYDLSPKLTENLSKVLNQFVRFSKGQRYQVANSETLRKFLKKGRMKNKILFTNAFKQIMVASKKCYVATYCFGQDHQITNDFRQFKVEVLAKSKLGIKFVDLYYQYSPGLVSFCQRNPKVGRFVTFTAQKCLLALRFLLKLTILK